MNAKQMKDVSRSAPEEYHLWYYGSNVWKKTSFLGIECRKSVSDMWNYQEIIWELKPALIVEFGTYCGGSGLFFARIHEQVTDRPKVLTVDVNRDRIDPRVFEVPTIEVMTTSSHDPAVYDRIRELRGEHPGPIFAILDSNHHKDHVLGEMQRLRDLLRPGDYVIVEDSNVNGHPVQEGWGPGPMEAMEEYMREFPNDYVLDEEREMKFGFTFAPRGFLKRC